MLCLVITRLFTSCFHDSIYIITLSITSVFFYLKRDIFKYFTLLILTKEFGCSISLCYIQIPWYYYPNPFEFSKANLRHDTTSTNIPIVDLDFLIDLDVERKRFTFGMSDIMTIIGIASKTFFNIFSYVCHIIKDTFQN